ncbi:unnamed protein product [Acanthoscelides obtectus]|nr:unnamed protein product [Acanthoscelides obtectus]CAK1675529.1 Zinc finger protein 639 [Acanthoscelides obtectus]
MAQYDRIHSLESKCKHIFHPYQPKSNTYICLQCKATFYLEDGLIKHLFPNQCKYCYRIFKQKRLLDIHQAKRHRNLSLPPYVSSSNKPILSTLKCLHCKAIFNQEDKLVEHLFEKHRNVTSFTAEVHGLYESFEYLKCTICSFRTNKGMIWLDKHLVRKHPDFIKPIASKTYEYSDFSFKTNIQDNPTKHIVAKEVLPPYVSPVKNLKSNTLTCLHCLAPFSQEVKLNHHLYEKHPNITMLIFEVHGLNHLGGRVEYLECKICSFRTNKGMIRLDNHIIETHPDVVKPKRSGIHVCNHCSFKTTVQDNLMKHMKAKEHVGLSLPPYVGSVKKLKSSTLKCLHCEATFNQESKLVEHLFKKHPTLTLLTTKVDGSNASVGYLKCTVCTFRTNKGMIWMDNHIVGKHPEFVKSIGSGIYLCSDCPFKTKIREILAKHILEHDSPATESAAFEEKQCSLCPFKTYIKEKMRLHMQDHEVSDEQETYSCCSFKTTSKQALDEHIIEDHFDQIKSVSSPVLECAHCSFKTTMESKLVKHISAHKAVLKIKHRWSKCNVGVTSKRQLNEHVAKSHPDSVGSTEPTSNGGFLCGHCDFTANNELDLSRHWESEHRHKCTFCNMICVSKRGVLNHLRMVHNMYIG